LTLAGGNTAPSTDDFDVGYKLGKKDGLQTMWAIMSIACEHKAEVACTHTGPQMFCACDGCPISTEDKK
jgi:hypothetical protein